MLMCKFSYFSSGVIESCVFWLKLSKNGDEFRRRQNMTILRGRALLCNMRQLVIRPVFIQCGFTCGRYRVICLVVVFTLPLSQRPCVKWLILCGILTVLEGRMVVVLINDVGLVASLDYRKTGGVQMLVQVGLYGSFRALSCTLLSHIHFIHARVYH